MQETTILRNSVVYRKNLMFLSPLKSCDTILSQGLCAFLRKRAGEVGDRLFYGAKDGKTENQDLTPNKLLLI